MSACDLLPLPSPPTAGSSARTRPSNSPAGGGDAASELARLLARRGDLDGAVQILRALADVGLGDAERLAELLRRQGRDEEAERLRRFGLNPNGSIACG